MSKRSPADIVITRKNSVTIVINDTDSLIIMPPSLSREDLVTVLQSALDQVIRADANVISYDSLEYEN